MSERSPRLGSRLLKVLCAVEDTILATILTAMILLATLQIVLRNVFDSGLTWADPLLRVSVLWIGMVGAMAATRDDRQISVDALSRFLSPHWIPRLRVVTDMFTAVVAGLLAWHAGRLVLGDRAAGMVAFAAVPVWACELVLPVAMGVIALRYGVYALRHLRTAVTAARESQA